jgi:hypothetical protein
MILEDIFKQVRHEIDDYKNGTIKIANGYNFNTYRLINKVIFYTNSKFESGDKDSRGRKKFFYNIVLFRRDTTKRLIDVDIKHFRIFSQNTMRQIKALFLEHGFKNWARDNDFGELLNEMAEDAATFGTTIIKLSKKLVPDVVDLRNVYFDQSAENLSKARYIIEEHLLTPAGLLEKKEDGWQNVDDLLERWKESGEEFIKVYERQGICPESWVKKGGKDNKFVKSWFFVADVDDYKKTRSGIIENGLVLWKGEVDEYTYFDFSIRKQKGRLLGVGDVELLLDAQIRRNEIANQKSVAMEISSKHLFITPDDTSLVGSNFITDYIDGTILRGTSLTPVATENRDLSSWKSEEQMWDLLADRLTFTYDVVRGESVPATTPATNALIQERQSLGNFGLMRQNFGLFLERFVGKYLLPKLVKQFNEKELLQIISNSLDDIEQVDAFLIEELKKNYISQYFEETGFAPPEEELADYEKKIKKEISKGGLVRAINYGKGYFKDFEYQVIVNVVNEKVDPTTEVINLQNFLNQIVNPQVLQDPLLRRFIYKIAEKIGIPVTDIQKIEETKAIQQTQSSQGLPKITQLLGGQVLNENEMSQTPTPPMGSVMTQ